jgi:hypothetical protein
MTFLSAAAAPSALKAMDAASQAIASNVRNRLAVSICVSPQCSPEYQLSGLFLDLYDNCFDGRKLKLPARTPRR